MKLFIIEDSVLMIARVAQAALSISGVTVVGSANKASRAVRAIEAVEPDAFVVDIHLPDGNGLAVLKTTKSARPEVRSVVFTNSTGEPYRRAAFAAGADHFLDKSTEFGMLLLILNGWAKHRSAQIVASASL
ncbi:MAG: response regulator transcription factor [Rhodocyclaceae bacterium]|nr:response regulator transcription factor [Rhodocyclaceae bacterium]